MFVCYIFFLLVTLITRGVCCRTFPVFREINLIEISVMISFPHACVSDHVRGKFFFLGEGHWGIFQKISREGKL